jgi:hypothetical protein
MKSSKLKTNKYVLIFCILHFAFLIACSQPILESEKCIESRNVVKRFYSFHIGNDMTPSSTYLEKRKEYLSKELLKQISGNIDSKKDYFTQTDDYPKAFRAGGCENAGKDTTKFEILLFWRNNEKNMQREIEVEAIKENNKWFVNKVTSKK